jgi:DNA-binding SARP family transcriptional activator
VTGPLPQPSLGPRHHGTPAVQPRLGLRNQLEDATIAARGAHAHAGAPAAAPLGGLVIDRYPVQLGKVQPPLLPEETLRRDRLLDWLHVRVHSRLVLVVADAGYGKTTLLADFSRRTRVRCLWYRLDEGDRDWAVLLNHLVAAGREIDPSFAPGTESLLRELATGGGDFEMALNTFTAELRSWVTVPTALIMDDYHLVDGAPEVRETIRRLLARGADRFALVIATRRRPTLPLARLRALGEVAELGTDDLRFDQQETELLFRETYGQPLEPDVLAELARHTDGWAATLRLAHATMRGLGPSEIRRVVRDLSGHRGDLHDYLAEEVVGSLPVELQAFLQRCALLAVVTPPLAAAAGQVDEAEARAHMEALEAGGMLSRRGQGVAAARLFHPLVRDFLVHRLAEELGEAGLALVHLRIARAAEPLDWAVAAEHYAAAGRPADVARVLEAAMPTIFGSGAYAQAEEYAQALADGLRGPVHEVLRARHELLRGEVEIGTHRARAVLAAAPEGSSTRSLALNTLIVAGFLNLDFTEVTRHAEELRSATADQGLQAIAEAALATGAASLDGDIQRMADTLTKSAMTHRELGQRRYFGISMLNLSWALRAMAMPEGTADAGRAAIDALRTAWAGQELAAARINIAWAAAFRGDLETARTEIDAAISDAPSHGMAEALIEGADILSSYVDSDAALVLLRQAPRLSMSQRGLAAYRDLVTAECLTRTGEPSEALSLLGQIPTELATGYPGFQAKVALAKATAALCLEHSSWVELATRAARLGERQSARECAAAARMLLAAGASASNGEFVADISAMPAAATVAAEGLVSRLSAVGALASQLLVSEARRRPMRWLPALRRALDNGSPEVRLASALIVEEVGTINDVVRLRRAARELTGSLRHPNLGRSLARRVALPVFIEDQGRVTLRIGARSVEGTSLRRKALALLCFLLTQPSYCATRDRAMEVLWPDADPEQALNSLHQTTYFLRRVIEPEYAEDLSPGYVHHEGDLVWLDPGLIDSRSNRCAHQLRSLGSPPSVEAVEELALEYQARFALDFAYEDWASSYRDSLHARYLETMERTISDEMDAGRVDRAIRLAQRALDVDPDADQVEVALLRLYRATGAHAAAAEQYAHYATVMRDQLGVEPPPLEDL